jgi:hypothetical protein
MGGAGGAAAWGVDPDHWANPALLGTTRGVRYEDGDVRYGIDGDPFLDFRARRLAVGYGGLGVALDGRPLDGLGGKRLDNPGFPGTAYSPDPAGPDLVVTPHEQIRGWSVGASLSGLAGSLAGWRGRPAPRWSRWGDLAFGYARKTDEFTVLGLGIAPVTGEDWGMLARSGGTLRGPRGAAVRLEGSYGFSVLNFNDAKDDFGTPAARPHRNALAARAALGIPEAWRRPLPAWLVAPDAALVALGGAWDAVHVTAGDSDRGSRGRRYWGLEADLAGVVQLRFGGQRVNPGGAYLRTQGWSVGLPVGRLGGFRYDRASVISPAGYGIERRLSGWTVWADPLELYRAWR